MERNALTTLLFRFLYLFSTVFISSSILYKYTEKHKLLPKRREDILMLGLLGWVHFLQNDPTDRVPACVGVSQFARVPATAGTYIKGYIHRTLIDSWAVALNGGWTNDVPRSARVNQCVDWHEALCTVECKEPSAASIAANDPSVSLLDNPKVGIAVIFDKWALLLEMKKRTIFNN